MCVCEIETLCVLLYVRVNVERCVSVPPVQAMTVPLYGFSSNASLSACACYSSAVGLPLGIALAVCVALFPDSG